MEVDRALYPNHVWSYDFVADQTVDGGRLRFLTEIDEFTREASWIEYAMFLNSHDVVRVLNQLVERRGYPANIKSDHGPEFVADASKNGSRIDRTIRTSSNPETLGGTYITNRSTASFGMVA